MARVYKAQHTLAQSEALLSESLLLRSFKHGVQQYSDLLIYSSIFTYKITVVLGRCLAYRSMGLVKVIMLSLNRSLPKKLPLHLKQTV